MRTQNSRSAQWARVFLYRCSGRRCLSCRQNAQLATTTSLVGTVIDSRDKAIQNAKVTAVEANTGDTYVMTTNEQGYYSREFVRVGVYNLTAEQPGFRKVIKARIQVNNNQSPSAR